MKFKIASVLELAVPISIAALLSAFLGCGGGGAYGNGTRAYDGLWHASMTIEPPAKGGTSEVQCAGPSLVDLTLEHGFGHTEAETDCLYGYASAVGWATYTTPMDVRVSFGAEVASAVIDVDVYSGPHLVGTCDTPNSCVAGEKFYMHR